MLSGRMRVVSRSLACEYRPMLEKCATVTGCGVSTAVVPDQGMKTTSPFIISSSTVTLELKNPSLCTGNRLPSSRRYVSNASPDTRCWWLKKQWPHTKYGLQTKHHNYQGITSNRYGSGIWNMDNNSLCTGNCFAANDRSLPVNVSQRLTTASLCTDNGLRTKRHYLPKALREGGGLRLNRQPKYTKDGLPTNHQCLPGAHQYVRSFKAVVSHEQCPAFTFNQVSYSIRKGSKATCSGSQTEGTCWKCQKHVFIDVFFCPSCSAIQPPDPNKDYFQIMNSERTFTINIQKLQAQYRNLQRLLHPDYFSQKSQKERDLSEKQSSLVNKAYRTLLTPISRGFYLLKLNGIKIGEGTDSDLDMPFIVEIMEINEKLEEALDGTEVQDIGNFIEAKYEELTEDVSTAFEKGDIQEATLLLTKMKYFSNLQEKVKARTTPS